MSSFLFVCSANKQRSKTAEDYFSEKFSEHQFFSAGTNLKICQKEGTNPLTEEDLETADLIFVMENKHRKIILENSKKNYADKITVLNIPDIYKYFQPELIEILNRKMTPFLDS